MAKKLFVSRKRNDGRTRINRRLREASSFSSSNDPEPSSSSSTVNSSAFSTEPTTENSLLSSPSLSLPPIDLSVFPSSDQLRKSKKTYSKKIEESESEEEKVDEESLFDDEKSSLEEEEFSFEDESDNDTSESEEEYEPEEESSETEYSSEEDSSEDDDFERNQTKEKRMKNEFFSGSEKFSTIDYENSVVTFINTFDVLCPVCKNISKGLFRQQKTTQTKIMFECKHCFVQKTNECSNVSVIKDNKQTEVSKIALRSYYAIKRNGLPDTALTSLFSLIGIPSPTDHFFKLVQNLFRDAVQKIAAESMANAVQEEGDKQNVRVMGPCNLHQHSESFGHLLCQQKMHLLF